MSSFNVDLTNCDIEPIHIPGKIQSHGFLIAIDKISQNINFVSDQVNQFLNVAPKDLLLKSFTVLNNFFDLPDANSNLGDLIKLGIITKNFDAITPYLLKIKHLTYYLIVTESENNWLLEFEPVTLQYDLQSLIGKSASIMLQGKNVTALLHAAAKEVKKLINYDRVMIYKFMDDGHGEVVAEEKEPDLEAFLGLHYPASDIPKQARALYKLNLTRLIADVSQTDAAILSHQKDAVLDLTNSHLRAVSPIHIQYLKNMGVCSSFSISLLCNGELWGLIACHNYTPKFIDYKAREGAKLIGEILSSALEYRQAEEDFDTVERFKDAANALAKQLNQEQFFTDALLAREISLLTLTKATGVAIYFDNTLKTKGIVPDEEDILTLIDWIKGVSDEAIYYTHRLPEIFHQANKYKNIAAGVLVCTISKDTHEMILWFKPEQITTVNWAGNPDKPVEINKDGLKMLSPRQSFETWAQVVNNTSARWLPEEISSVLRIREIIITHINKKANEIRQLNEKLQLAYNELDTFSYTISHDLRTPLTAIKTYTELLMKNKSIDEMGKKMLDRILVGADKMNFLINEILNLARVGRSEIIYETIDVASLLTEITNELWSAFKADKVELNLGQLPDLKGDKTLIMQVFTNLLSNAIKYSIKVDKPVIAVYGTVTDNEIIYAVKDNGIGIDNLYYDRVFELFKRMNNAEDVEGTGVGLAIVKRIVEKHNGRVWFESKLEVGSTFYVAFKNN